MGISLSRGSVQNEMVTATTTSSRVDIADTFAAETSSRESCAGYCRMRRHRCVHAASTRSAARSAVRSARRRARRRDRCADLASIPKNDVPSSSRQKCFAAAAGSPHGDLTGQPHRIPLYRVVRILGTAGRSGHPTTGEWLAARPATPQCAPPSPLDGNDVRALDRSGARSAALRGTWGVRTMCVTLKLIF
jgi:hypothetical protein